MYKQLLFCAYICGTVHSIPLYAMEHAVLNKVCIKGAADNIHVYVGSSKEAFKIEPIDRPQLTCCTYYKDGVLEVDVKDDQAKELHVTLPQGVSAHIISKSKISLQCKEGKVEALTNSYHVITGRAVQRHSSGKLFLKNEKFPNIGFCHKDVFNCSAIGNIHPTQYILTAPDLVQVQIITPSSPDIKAHMHNKRSKSLNDTYFQGLKLLLAQISRFFVKTTT